MASPRSRPNWCLKMEVIVTPAPLPTRVTKEATVTIPIVMSQGCIPDGSVKIPFEIPIPGGPYCVI